jgi:predicted nucleic acid-binding protein
MFALAPEARRARGLVDTSVVIDPPDAESLPQEIAISTITLAELAAGTHVAGGALERAARQERLQRIETTIEAIPFDAAAARAYGRLVAAVVAMGRKARGRRAVDLLIAATAASQGLPLFTRNPDDLAGLERVVAVVSVPPRASARTARRPRKG